MIYKNILQIFYLFQIKNFTSTVQVINKKINTNKFINKSAQCKL